MATDLEDIRKIVFGVLSPLTVLPGLPVDVTKLGMDLLSAVKEYGDKRYEEGKTDGQRLALLALGVGYVLGGGAKDK